MRPILCLLFAATCNAAYVSTEIVRVVQLKENNVVVGFRIHYVVNDTAYPPVSPGLSNPDDPNSAPLPPISPLQDSITIRGANYDAIKVMTGATRRNAIWELIRPDIRHFYRTQINIPVKVEEQDVSSPIVGPLSTQAP